MSKYFEGLKFPELEDKEVKSVAPEEADKIQVKITDMLTEVRRIFAGVISGESSLVPHGVQLGPNTPCIVALERLEKNPTKSNLANLLAASRQDIGLSASVEIARIFDEIINPEKKEKK